jgi:hypothetical protein
VSDERDGRRPPPSPSGCPTACRIWCELCGCGRGLAAPAPGSACMSAASRLPPVSARHRAREPSADGGRTVFRCGCATLAPVRNSAADRRPRSVQGRLRGCARVSEEPPAQQGRLSRRCRHNPRPLEEPDSTPATTPPTAQRLAPQPRFLALGIGSSFSRIGERSISPSGRIVPTCSHESLTRKAIHAHVGTTTRSAQSAIP